ncbi:hypothetical protein [Pandoraea communis]|nr:hypothetical protein [Pandoraea communis]
MNTLQPSSTGLSVVDGESNRPAVIAVNALRPGDILLHYRSKQKLMSRAIVNVTGSPYTHASIYLGEQQIAEASPPKVRRRSLADAIADDSHVAVFRSQLGFDATRVATLNAFMEDLLMRNTWYDFGSLIGFKKRLEVNAAKQLELLAQHLADNAPSYDYVNRSYFCSALVVACYCVVGIIGTSASTIYEPNLFSPGGLADDPTFGHIVGYLADAAYQIPVDDPFLHRSNFKAVFGTEWI